MRLYSNKTLLAMTSGWSAGIICWPIWSFVPSCWVIVHMWVYHSLFIHSLIDGHPSRFQFWAIMNKATSRMFLCKIVVHLSFNFSWIDTEEWNCCHRVDVELLKVLLDGFVESLYHFRLLSTAQEGSGCSSSLPVLGIAFFLQSW